MKKLLFVILSLLMSCCSHVKYNKATPHSVQFSVASIEAYMIVPGKDPIYGGNGSGIAVGPNEILTAGHVCDILDIPNTVLRLRYSDGKIIKRLQSNLIVIKKSTDTDLCLLYTRDVVLWPLRVAKKSPKHGDKIFVYGSPAGVFGILTDGYYSHKTECGTRKGKIDCMIYSVQAYFGNSGGVVFNEKGKIIGVLVGGKVGYNQISYSPTLSDIHKFLEK